MFKGEKWLAGEPIAGVNGVEHLLNFCEMFKVDRLFYRGIAEWMINPVGCIDNKGWAVKNYQVAVGLAAYRGSLLLNVYASVAKAVESINDIFLLLVYLSGRILSWLCYWCAYSSIFELAGDA